ncbi:MAG: PVC-type heme-binding CxxCH protein [Planctomycetota bacterium]
MLKRTLAQAALALLASSADARPLLPQVRPRLEPGDRVVLVGGALAERLQHDGWFETRLQLAFPELDLSFRNLGFSADTLTVRQRVDGFGTPDEWLARSQADVVFAFWGFNESFDGEPGRAAFRTELAAWVEHVRGLRNAADRPLRVVLFSSVPFANPGNPSLPAGGELNARLARYDETQAEVAAALGVPLVDLATPLRTRQARGAAGLSINGVHLTEAGNEVLADAVAHAFGIEQHPDAARQSAVREVVREKDLLWFNRYQATDGYNVHGGRSSLSYDGVTNFEVLQRELEVLDALCDQLDLAIRAVARGEPRPAAPAIGAGSIPPLIEVATNLPGEGPGGTHLYLGGEEALAKMTAAPGLRVELFADEARFPELANPVQMSFDTQGRLWVAVWPTYPHWKPGSPMNDKLLVFEDDDGDGRADRVQSFADDLHNPTGFEFWGGGVFVANPPDVLFLRDTDGDGVADERRRVLHGLSSGDTHHSANSFVLGPDGALYFQEGIFHRSQVETIHGPVRNRDAAVWRFEPRTWRVERHVAYDFLNPHGHVFDRWGQDCVTDGTTNENFWAAPFAGYLDAPHKHPHYSTFFAQRSRPAAATEILSSRHFPEANQGNYLIANVIGFRGIFQYAFEDDGSGFGAREVEPLVFSADPNFRPVDLEVGPDGAVWFVDWHNALIGHMQHHLRDPSRDHEHGRVYRVVAEGRELLRAEDLSALPTSALVERLASREDRVRYRTRIELSARPSDEVEAAALAWLDALDAGEQGYEHHRLEVLWTLQQHDRVNTRVLESTLAARDPRARAAAIRVVRGQRRRLVDPLPYLSDAVRDEHARVRLEAVVACSFLDSAAAAAVALSALEQPTDRFLDYALSETVRALAPRWRAALAAGDANPARDNPRALAYLLAGLSDAELAALRPESLGAGEIALWEERLWRQGLEPVDVLAALRALARLRGVGADAEFVRAVARADLDTGEHADHRLMGLFAVVTALDAPERARLETDLRRLARNGMRTSTRRLALRARMQTEGAVGPTWDEAAASPASLADLLDALRLVDEPQLAAPLFERVRGVLTASAPAAPAAVRGRFVRVELSGPARTLTLAEVEVLSGGTNVARAGTASQSSTAWDGAAARAIDGNHSPRFGDAGQTHTVEDEPDPWWELDLGRELPLEAVVLWNRGDEDGRFAARLDGARVRVLDAERRALFESELGRAPLDPVRIEVGAPEALLRARAVRALSALAGPAGRVDEAVNELVLRFDDPSLRPHVVAALRDVPFARWPGSARVTLGRALTAHFEAAAGSAFDDAHEHELLAFADELAPQLAPAQARALRVARRPLGPQVIVIRSVPDSLRYDRAEFSVVAGRPVELVFENVDIMPHNLVVTAPGSLARVGLAAERMSESPDAASRDYLPDLPEVLHATRLLQPGAREVLNFTAPTTPADHPYVCTFPGHWLRMNGVMHVLADWNELDEPTNGAPVAASSGRAFVRDWTAAELLPALAKRPSGSPSAGRRVLELASCVRCHAVDGAGGRTGPDLREVTARRSAAELIAHVISPSLEIAPQYVNEIFFMQDGTLHAGRVVRESGGSVFLQEDPYSELEPTEVSLADVEKRVVSNLSTMPAGLLNTFERAEILDLIAYLASLAPDPTRSIK